MQESIDTFDTSNMEAANVDLGATREYLDEVISNPA
jgi:hypothetical protein